MEISRERLYEIVLTNIANYLLQTSVDAIPFTPQGCAHLGHRIADVLDEMANNRGNFTIETYDGYSGFRIEVQKIDTVYEANQDTFQRLTIKT